MYNIHQDATYLPITLKTNDYTLANDKLPAVSASASKDKNGLTHISLVNIDMNKSQDINVDVSKYKFSNVTGRILTSSKVQDHNTFDNPDKVKPAAFTGASLKGNNLSVKLPPFSVVVLELK
jgi:alpha-L-arabinofuranosidase